MAVVWITGAHGFIGRQVARNLTTRGETVAGVGHGIWPEIEAETYGVRHWVNGEISNGNLESLQAATGLPCAIVHLAGGSSVGASFANPHEDFERTCATTARLLEWVRQRSGDTRVIAVSSAAVYGNGHAAPISEDAPLRPYSPYGLHKRFMEDLCFQYAGDFGLHCGVVRLFSVFGAGLRKQLLWDACSRLARGETKLRFGGTGEETRDWTHVDDVARIVAEVALRVQGAPSLLNVATGTAIPVREVVDCLVQAWGSDATIEFSGESRPGDPRHLVADNSRLRDWLAPSWHDARAGFAEYVSWFRSRTST